jgi:hypothetical protein
MDIRQLMAVPASQHDLAWLKEALQNAVRLELATIPPYLCAWWSVVDEGHPAADTIRGIALEEMLHMGLACNMLNTIGGTPRIDTPDAVPTYPGELPGGVHPGLRVALAALSKDVISRVFMEIEYPEGGPVALAMGETFPTIGAFYNAIHDAFASLPDGTITGAKQLFSPGVGLFKVQSLADVKKAVLEIKEQGEGTSQSPLSVDFGGDLAHYYKFAEIFHEHRLVRDAEGQWKFEGETLPFPEVFPMAEVPPGGYPESLDFDKKFTTVLNKLQAAWESGSQAQLSGAVGAMLALNDPARALMQTPRPDGQGNLGPDFRLITQAPA